MAASAGSNCSTASARIPTRRLDIGNGRTPAGSAIATGPETKRTSAPSRASAAAMACPCLPEERFAMKRTGSIGSWVGPCRDHDASAGERLVLCGSALLAAAPRSPRRSPAARPCGRRLPRRSPPSRRGSDRPRWTPSAERAFSEIARVAGFDPHVADSWRAPSTSACRSRAAPRSQGRWPVRWRASPSNRRWPGRRRRGRPRGPAGYARHPARPGGRTGR